MPRLRTATVLFTGLIRNEEMLARSLEDLSHLPRIDRILMVTWEAEAARHAGFLDFAQPRFPKLHVVTLPEPPPITLNGHPDRGNLIPQMVALHAGLAVLDDDDWCLKTRTDLHIAPAMIEHMLDCDTAVRDGGPLPHCPPVFSQRVVIGAADISSPFYCADLFLFGLVEDLRRLCSVDLRYDYFFDMNPGHIHNRRFAQPFLALAPLFERFFESERFIGVNSPVSVARTPDGVPVYRAEMLRFLTRQREYAVTMLLCYALLDRFFILIRDQFPDALAIRSFDDRRVGRVVGQRTPRFLWCAPDETVNWTEGAGVMTWSNDYFVTMLSNRYDASAPAAVFAEALAMIAGTDDLRRLHREFDFPAYHRRVRAESARVLATMGLPPERL